MKRLRQTFTITVEFGEPMSSSLRRQRFQSFMDDAPPTASSWTVNVPTDIVNGTFTTRLETESEDEFKAVRSAIQAMSTQVMPFSNVIYSGINPIEDHIVTTENVVALGTKDVKMKCESACGKVIVFYPCGKVVFKFPAKMEIGEKLTIIRRQHLKWLKSQDNTTLDWPDLHEVNHCYENDTSIDKITRFTLESALKEKLVYFAMDKYNLSLRYKQVSSLRKMTVRGMMASIHDIHREWLEQQTEVEPSLFTKLESLYINDRFLDDDTRKSLHGPLWYKHYVIWQGKETKRLQKAYVKRHGRQDWFTYESESDDSYESS